eukprot:3152096-Rhodomonas_salina.1
MAAFSSYPGTGYPGTPGYPRGNTLVGCATPKLGITTRVPGGYKCTRTRVPGQQVTPAGVQKASYPSNRVARRAAADFTSSNPGPTFVETPKTQDFAKAFSPRTCQQCGRSNGHGTRKASKKELEGPLTKRIGFNMAPGRVRSAHAQTRTHAIV